MTSVEEITAAIVSKGDEIRSLKSANPPTLKDDLKPLVAELQALKLQYKDATGKDFGAQSESEKSSQPKEKQLTKKDLRKLEKEAKQAELIKKSEEITSAQCGDYPLIQSAFITDKCYRNIREFSSDMVGQRVWIRARVAASRAVGKACFLVLRQTLYTVQAVIFQGDDVPKEMVKYTAGISLESVVDVLAEVSVPAEPVQGTTVKNFELKVYEIHAVSRAALLPFQVEDAGRNEDEAREKELPIVNQDLLLNYRWIDTRTPANQAIFRLQAAVCLLFREYFTSKDFVEIHTPKLIGGASEGGSNVFTFKYFDQPACLAQSPQLYKQMTAACGGFERVFEIGPVFRAENSNTHRHLCEFTGLDFEMVINEHYYEALEVLKKYYIHA